MTCREFADFITDYVSGGLPSEQKTAFELHLRLCGNCRKYLTSYEEAMKLGKRAFDDEADAAASADVPEELVRAILAARRSVLLVQRLNQVKDLALFGGWTVRRCNGWIRPTCSRPIGRNAWSPRTAFCTSRAVPTPA